MNLNRFLRRPGRAAGAVAGVCALACVGAVEASATAGASAPKITVPSHVFVIMMENHGLKQIIGNTADAPYINKLAARYDLSLNYHGVTHPSLPEYLAAISGSFQGIWDDCKAGLTSTCAPEEFVPDSGDSTDKARLTPTEQASATATPHMFSGKTIVNQLERKGMTWKAYMQSIPSAGSQVEYAPVIDGTTVKLYAQKHDPFMYFSATTTPAELRKVVPFTGFSSDLARKHVPNLVWISPDQCHDMHSISSTNAALIHMPKCVAPSTGLDHSVIKLGDDFVRQTVRQIMASKTWRTTKSSIVLLWDENDYSGYSGGPGSPTGENGVVLGGGDAPLLVINSWKQKRLVSRTPADEYTVLSTLQKLWHLGCLANTCSASTSGNLLSLFSAR